MLFWLVRHARPIFDDLRAAVNTHTGGSAPTRTLIERPRLLHLHSGFVAVQHR